MEILETRTLLNASLPQPISIDTTGAAMGNGSSSSSNFSSMSDNGQYEVFTSNANNLVNNVAVNGSNHVYLRNLVNGTTTLVDIGSSGTEAGNSFADSPVISGDGRFVAFRSGDTNLTSNATNGYYQTFVRDMQTGQTYLVSLDSAGASGGFGFSNTPTISESNGKLLIAYQSSAQDLVSGDSSGNYQVFLTTFDLDNTGAVEYKTLSTKLISADSTGNGANNTSQTPLLSKDGSTLAFQSAATNLPGGSTSGNLQIYAYNIGTGTLSLVSHNSGGNNGGDSTSDSYTLSDNGQYLAFRSSADDLLSGVSGDQIYVWTQSNGTLTLISANSSGGAEGANNVNPIISGDGSTVVFTSYGNDFTSTNLNPTGNWQVWSRNWNASTPVTTLVSVNSAGVGGDNTSGYNSYPSLSDNGQIVSFDSSANDLTNNSADAGTYPQIFVRDMGTNTTTLVSIDSAGSNGGNGRADTPILSTNGGTVVFESQANDLISAVDLADGADNVFAYNLTNNTLSLVSIKATGLFAGNASSDSLTLSDNGQDVAFFSSASDLIPGVYGGQVYAWAGNVLTLISVNSSGGAESANNSDFVLSGDGSTVAFTSDAADLTSGNLNPDQYWQVWSRDWKASNPTTTLISVNSTGTVGGDNNADPLNLSISDNGQVIAFGSLATDLTNNSADASSYEQIFVRNAATNTTTLVSVDSAGSNGGNNYADTPILSADGSTVVFQSRASDLTNALDISDGSYNVFAYNLTNNTLSLVSIKAAGLFAGDSTSDSLTLSDVGQDVAFRSDASDLLAGVAGSQVYGWAGNILTLLSVNSSGGAEDSGAYNPVISGDGSTVAFVSSGNDLVNGNVNPNGYYQVWSRNWKASNPTTTLISVNSTGTVGGDFYSGINYYYGYNLGLSISDNGQVIAFGSDANDLTNNSADTSYSNPQVFVRNVATNTTTLVSVDSAGSNGGNNVADTPILSADGSTVVFESRASDLTSALDIANGNYNVFAYNLTNNTLSLVSIKAAGLFAGDSTSDSLTLSDDGQDVAFRSDDSDLLAGVAGSQVYGWAGNILTLISVNSSGGADNAGGTDPVISGDGSTVAFVSSGNDLTSGNLNPNGYYQVWSRNWKASNPTTTLISVNSTGTVGGDFYSGINYYYGYNLGLSISDNGQVIAFGSDANDLTGNSADTSYNNPQVFVRNVTAGTTKLVSVDSAGSNGGNNVADTPILSADGSTVVFESRASDLTSALDIANGNYNVFAYNLNTNVLSLVSIKAAGLFAGNSTSDDLSLSDNGQTAAFYSSSSDLLGDVPGGEVYGWAGNILTLISVNSAGGAETNSVPDNLALSGDGSTVAFVSSGNDLVSGNMNPNGNYQVYSRNWKASKPVTTLISVNSTGTIGGDSYSSVNYYYGYNLNPSISDNGQVIAFGSDANDLTNNSADTSYNNPQIFVRNVAEGITTLASVDSAGSNGGNAPSDTPTLSANGRIVTFNSVATDLVAGVSVPSGSSDNVYFTPIPLAQFVVTASSPQTAGSSFQITVTAEDSSGNVLTGYTGTVHFSSTDAKAVLPSDTTLTNGTGTFTVTLKTAGTQTITATDTQDASVTGISNPIAVNPATASQLVFSQQPSDAEQNQTIAPPVTVLEEDQYGNVETGDNSTQVSMALGGTVPTGAVLSGTLTETVKDGVATFGDLSINEAGSGYQLIASSGSLTQATSNTFTIIAVPTPTSLAFLQGPTNTIAGATISPAVTVEILDQYGHLVSGDNSDKVTLVLTNNTTGGVLNGTLTEQVSGGIATFGDLSIDQAGDYTLAASSPTSPKLFDGTSNFFTISPTTAAQLVFLTQPSNTPAGSAISPAVQAALEDKYGNIETGDYSDQVSVALGAGSPSGTLNGTLTETVSSGVATFGDLSINQAGNGYTLVASSTVNGTNLSVTSNAFNITPALPHLVFTQQPGNTVAGVAISPAVTITLEDQYGNIETSDSTDQVTMALGIGSPSGTLNGTLTETFSQGVATFSDLSINQAGTGYTLAASSTVNSANLSVTSNAFNISPAAASQVAFSQQPTDTTAGATISPAVTVLIEDKFGNVETGDNSDQVSVALGGTSPAGGVLHGTLTETVSGGKATFGDLSINQAGTGYQLVASSGSLTTATSSPFTIEPAPTPTQLVFQQQPTNTTAGSTIAPAVTVLIEDQYGNIESGDSSDTVSLTLTNNTTGGVLNGTLTEQVSGGKATFSDLSINQAGTYTLTANSSTDTKLTDATSSFFTISASRATHLAFWTQPSNTTAGSAISPAVQVAIEDKFGNVETGDSADNVTVALGAGSPAGGVLNGTLSEKVSNGIAAFGDLSINQAGTGYSLAASSTVNGTNLSITSNVFAITPAAAAQLVFQTQPSNTTAGVTISPAVTILIEDKFGNVESGDSTDQVTVALGAGSPSGTLNGTLTETVSSGKASFGDLSINQAGTGYTLAASSTINSTNLSVTSNPFNITPAAAAQLVFLQQPTNTTAGAIISPAVTVLIEDKFGNVETGDSSDQVSVALGAGSPSGTLNGTLTETASNGKATFGDLSINQAGNGYTLVASSTVNSTNLTITSNPFNITPAAPHLLFETQPSDTTAGATINTIQVAIEDQFGNVETNDNTDTVTLVLGPGSPSATLNGTLTEQVSGGVATFSDLSIDQAGKGFTLVASSPTNTALSSITSNVFAITPATATQLVFQTQPSNTTAGATISPAVTILIEDMFGNLETGDSTDTVQLAIGINPNNGVLNGTTSETVSGGVATFGDLSINQAGNGYTLVASSQTNTKPTQATSNDFNITPAAAAQMVFLQQPTNAAAGADIRPAVKVAIEDKFGNIETGDNSDQVGIAIGTNPGGGTLSGTTPQTVVNGVATFGDLSINNAGNGYTLVASSTVGATSLQVTSNTFDIFSSGPRNVSSDFSISRTGFRYNFALREFVLTVTLTNISGTTLNGPLAMQLINLSSDASLANPSGTFDGNPYIDFLSDGQSLAAGKSVSVVLYFRDPTLQPITYDTQEWQGLA